MKKLLLLYGFLTVLFITQTLAIVRTEEVEEWTRDDVGTYFNRYKDVYERKKDYQTFGELAESYKNAAADNVKYFFGTTVDQIVSGFSATLHKNTKLAQNDIDEYISNLKHDLRRLEIKGQLTKEHIGAVLDKAHHEAIRKKIMTEAEWKEAYARFESYFTQPTWYQRVLGRKSFLEQSASGFNNWVQSVTDRVAHVGGLTKEQAKEIGEHVRSSVTNTDLQKLGDKSWLDNMTRTLSRHSQIKKDQLDKIVESLNEDIQSYRSYGLEYTGQATQEVKHWYYRIKVFWINVRSRVGSFVHHCKHNFYRTFNEKNIKKHKSHLYNTASSVSSKMSSASSKASRSATSLGHKASKSVTSIRYEAGKSASSVYSNADRATSTLKSNAHMATNSIHSAASSISSEYDSYTNSVARSRTMHSLYARATNAPANAYNRAYHKLHDGKTDLKGSFAYFWRQKEQDYYRRLGYTEAHIDWIQNYLYKTFKKEKSSVHSKADAASIAIKRYLHGLGIQTPAQIDQNVHKLIRHLESWRTLVV
ncbi:hypothetical protein BDF20DRAFT_881003 [Mycotypha africana]|uniref:uncharacterized protein n=1 Tax=Mycotypha africana TaxID=64632 RepID=UPI002300182D|nr:uncharacterized protein BDF20DRAFT_881003 [Mycotypha africana]KAI8973202.1 hypothetical protein BDF20DRAFT_881003 [Mycotypha africana]